MSRNVGNKNRKPTNCLDRVFHSWPHSQIVDWVEPCIPLGDPILVDSTTSSTKQVWEVTEDWTRTSEHPLVDPSEQATQSPCDKELAIHCYQHVPVF